MIEDLKKFIARALSSRKYAPNTASGIKVALGYFEKELNEEEKESIKAFKDNFEQIYMSVFRNNSQIAPASLEIYKRRVKNLLNDYELYAGNPPKFAAWTPKKTIGGLHIKKNKNAKAQTDLDPNVQRTIEVAESNLNNDDSIRFELPLRPNVKVFIRAPRDLTPQDIKEIKNFIDYIGTLVKNKVTEV